MMNVENDLLKYHSLRLMTNYNVIICCVYYFWPFFQRRPFKATTIGIMVCKINNIFK